MSRLLLLSTLFFIYACGGGGSSTPNQQDISGSGTGSGYSVPGSFQPVDSE